MAVAVEGSRRKERILCLFDVDGTLTPARQVRAPEVPEALARCHAGIRDPAWSWQRHVNADTLAPRSGMWNAVAPVPVTERRGPWPSRPRRCARGLTPTFFSRAQTLHPLLGAASMGGRPGVPGPRLAQAHSCALECPTLFQP